MQQPALTPAIHAGSLARTGAFQTAGVHATPSVLWSFTPPDALFATPALVDQGTIYIGCDDGRVYAIETATGTVRWTFATHDPDPDADPEEEAFPEVTELCLDVESGYAYVGSIVGVLYEVDLATGGELRRWILPELLSAVTFEGDAYITALTREGEHLLFAVGESFDQVFTVLDRRTGALTFDEYVRLAISRMTVRTGAAPLACTVSSIGNHGEENLWALRLPDATHAYLRAYPVSVALGFDEHWEAGAVDVGETSGYLPLVDDTLFAVGMILPGPDAQEDEPTERLLALDPESGAVRWSCADLTDPAPAGFGGGRSLAAADDLVYVLLPSAGVVDAVDRRTHAVRWRFRSAPSLSVDRSALLPVGDTETHSSAAEMLVADGELYLLEYLEQTTEATSGFARERTVRICALDAQTGALAWSYSQRGHGAHRSEVCSAIADGVLYLVEDSVVSALSALSALR
jgi:outer membrane protein assembly factor BamB